ncbi:hypothetical protein [Cellulomonas cellasea]|uniref:Uncharacterized protein n=1 Tax=Cellulomonas cellasea TaxID=43670 RepID=A0A7W4YEF4_9CELL|nr:hypothetical protein [Cellulomonas cellasea]MBB2925526.1 hypothetical protein [Cellulomonas cellasea]
MSFDVFVQRFFRGDAADVDEHAVREWLRPYVVEVDADSSFARLAVGDGEADLYGWSTLSRGFMVNHVSGTDPWRLLVDIAGAANLTVLPVGCPAAVTDATALEHLPGELRASAVILTTRDALLHLITEA